uniref:Uncharacterized protein n=1 Tax=Arundo donax TaxID=35708 RepID=A0A0A9BP33_ARUDO
MLENLLLCSDTLFPPLRNYSSRICLRHHGRFTAGGGSRRTANADPS